MVSIEGKPFIDIEAEKRHKKTDKFSFKLKSYQDLRS